MLMGDVVVVAGPASSEITPGLSEPASSQLIVSPKISGSLQRIAAFLRKASPFLRIAHSEQIMGR
jgi:hypothetical protein